MTLSIQTTGLDADGIGLLSPASADFDARLGALLPHTAHLALGLKPLLAIVSNESSRAVVAYAVTFWITWSWGEMKRTTCQFKYPDAVSACARLRGREVGPHEERVVGTHFELGPDSDLVANWESYGESPNERENISKLHIELDAAILDDGVLLGPDHSGLSEEFAAYVTAKQELYRETIDRMDDGGPASDVFAPLRESVSRRAADVVGALLRSREDPQAWYRTEAAAELLGWEHTVMRELFAEALRREPFRIHRRTDP